MSVSDFPGTGNAGGEPQPLASPERDLAIWWCPLARDAAAMPALWATLSPEEVARAGRFGTDALRQRYVVGRAALRWTLAQRLGIDPAAVAIRRGERGRPMLDEGRAPDFNVTHTLGVALIAHLDRPGWRVGVDIEGVDRTLSHDALARKFLTDRERSAIAMLDDDARRRAFLRLWTCKEAMSKATGDGLSAPFREIGIDTTAGLVVTEGPEPYAPHRWALHPVPVSDDLYATVALWSATPPPANSR
ncbi:MAG: 4'-phosphopantetheinyl transferase superfamily protein [Betaproteobacteria bacterium]|nr:4'-phosphopantetheinyl transferase superfamily protein [Betaproteobacteria bacterium]